MLCVDNELINLKPRYSVLHISKSKNCYHFVKTPIIAVLLLYIENAFLSATFSIFIFQHSFAI